MDTATCERCRRIGLFANVGRVIDIGEIDRTQCLPDKPTDSPS
jgi:hypothetical protein